MARGEETDLYSVRRVGESWSVYRWSTLEIAYARGEPQVDLERDVAEAIAEHLTRIERKRSRAVQAVSLPAAA